ncbi:precorrin-6y C5,15-methyltransferase (decarboxylating) subunit CbiE [Candidatus Thiodictyon syntrophicum]|jgi:precorrin-6Y C5,15-methyltransferase (decarboxylating)|uniref:Cobalamin biosynthesis bifunctional protein CbiET n=1 Tax=Candidatus Thiodictyon syntrophicum TaxID=1166950 RepID=A0A2K8UJ25_9GAMM|nr:precorrin-6y C5,15-methyltransferase (decarboxylating) subunit CbiE [Candidatus Thiodictyon syntrophicum]AUB85522.1 cobalamin biosynthesis bifunctional protein CbiET [Candidatus Thiodictyon syntrophicum]
MTETCTLIGILDDGWPGLADAARARLTAAGCVIGAARTLDLVASRLAPGARQLPMDGALAQVPGWVRQAWAEGLRVAVLATGDPLCHGIGGRLMAALGAAAIEVLPAPSTLQLACARLKVPWQGAHIASCHSAGSGEWEPGATPAHALYQVVQAVAQYPLVGVFTSPENGPDRIARALLTVGYGEEISLSVAARLDCPDEALFPDLSLEEAAGLEFAGPNIVILERGLERGAAGKPGRGGAGVAAGRRSHMVGSDPVFGLADGDFAQQRPRVGEGAGLITKLEVRAVSLAKLALRPDSLVWDIGAGSGAVGLEASRISYAGHVWAIERAAAQAADARANARRLRAGNYSLYEGEAPAGLDAWPDPDAVFIGGSGGGLEALIELVAGRLRPGGHLVLNLVTLENLATATAALDRADLAWDLIQLALARSRPIRGLHRLAALNPVWILTAARLPNDEDLLSANKRK